MDKLKALLNLKPFKLDLSDTLAKGLQFWNQGIALDATGPSGRRRQRLSLDRLL